MADDAPARTFTVIPVVGELLEIRLPFDPREVWGRARPPVVVTIGDYSYRSTVAIMGGETFVPLRRSHREAAGAWDRWEKLSFTHQREHVEAVEGAKKPETRARRVEKCVAMVTG